MPDRGGVPVTGVDPARARAVEVVTEELDQHAGSGADAAEWAIDALLRRPEVLRDLIGSTVREWGTNDIADDPNAPDGDVDPADDEEDAQRIAASWAGGRVCWRDVTYGPWRTR